jgi:hypothetical protein
VGERPDVYEEERVRAAKEHRCLICGRPIVKGTLHVSVKGLWDGQWSRFRAHNACYEFHAELEELLPKWWDGGCLSFGDEIEAVQEIGNPALIRRWAEVSGADPAPLLREWAGEGEA